MGGLEDVHAALAVPNLISASSLERVRRIAAQTGDRLDLVAMKLGLLAERSVAILYADTLGSKLVSLEELPEILPSELSMPPQFLRSARVIPMCDTPVGAAVAMADPFDLQARRAMEFALDRPVIPHAVLPADIETALDRLFGKEMDETPHKAGAEDEAATADLDRLKDAASEAPVIRLVNQLVTRAVEARASDIHVEATDSGLRVRCRVDGVLQEMEPPPATLRAAVVSRIKIMAKLDIAVRQLAQDGRIRLAIRGREVDFRVSTTPSVHGESVVLRVLDRSTLQLDFRGARFRWRAAAPLRGSTQAPERRAPCDRPDR